MAFRKKDLSCYKLQCEETGKELGRGSYATVSELTYKGLRCAGKKIYQTLYSSNVEDHIARFSDECNLISQLRHPNIVQFLGVYFERGNEEVPILVLEYVPITLAQCLDRNNALPLDINYSILMDVILGLRYLHEQAPPIIHRDLSANNVLLTENLTAKISDLGVAKIVNISMAMVSRLTAVPGTPCYMPPEALVPNPKYDASIDIFSYGILVIHTFSGQWPLPTEANILDPNQQHRLIPVSEADRRIDYLDAMSDNPLLDMTRSCLHNNYTLRPKAADIWKKISDVLAQNPPSYRKKLETLLKLAENTGFSTSLTGSAKNSLSDQPKEKPFGSNRQTVSARRWEESSPTNFTDNNATTTSTENQMNRFKQFNQSEKKKVTPVKAEKPKKNLSPKTTPPKPAKAAPPPDGSPRKEPQEPPKSALDNWRANRVERLNEKPKKTAADSWMANKKAADEIEKPPPKKNFGIEGRGLNTAFLKVEDTSTPARVEPKKNPEPTQPKKKFGDAWLANTMAAEKAEKVKEESKIQTHATNNPKSGTGNGGGVANSWLQAQRESKPPIPEVPTPSAKQQPKPRTMARVLYNFDARDNDEMSVQQGELVEILDMEDMSGNAQWLMAKKGNRTGTVPSNYVSIEKQEPATPSPTNTLPSTKTAGVVLRKKEGEKKPYANLGIGANNPPTSNRASIAMDRSEFSKRKKLLESMVGGGGGGRVEPIAEQPIPQPVQPVQPVQPAYEVYIALYTYRAADEDEVSFQKGDEALVTTVLDEGWMEGTIRRTGVYGMLPANYFAKQ